MTLPIVDRPGARPWPPRVSSFTRPFWEALAQGRLLTTRGKTGRQLTFPPKPFCPHSWEREVEWVELSGRGTLYSRTVVHAAPALFAAEAPYQVCIVDYDEGIRVATRLIEAPEDIRLDSRVETVVLRYSDGPLFAVRPA
ncbi:MAG: DNA-binding protein [Alphaproteobacteria bacterium]|nr:DNA-binding protein [Alphaproteobacteria bacterium]